MRYLNTLLVMILAVTLAACTSGPQIPEGSIVKVQYQGTLKDGSVFDTTEGKAPLAFLVGAQQVIPEFESQVRSIAEGKTKKFTIKAKNAYGEPSEEKIVTLPRDGRFKDLELKEGAKIFANNKGPDGKVVQTPLTIKKVSEKEVTMDYNHPLAGQDLTFEVTVVEVQEPNAATETATANPEENKAEATTKAPEAKEAAHS